MRATAFSRRPLAGATFLALVSVAVVMIVVVATMFALGSPATAKKPTRPPTPSPTPSPTASTTAAPSPTTSPTGGPTASPSPTATADVSPTTTVEATPSDPTTAPLQLVMVTDLRVTSVLSTEYTVGWTGVEGATAYQVDDGYGYAGTAWGYGPGFLYTVRDRKPGTTYFVQVRAYTNTENGVVFGPAASITVTTNPAGTCWVPSEQPVTVSTTWRTYQMAGECTFAAHRYQYTLSQDTVFIYGPAPSAGATTLWQYRYHVAGPLDGVAFEYAGLAWTYASDEPYQPICDQPDAKCVTTDDPPSDGGEGF